MSGPALGLPSAPLTRARARTERPEFTPAMSELRDAAEAALASPLKPRAETAGYYHAYFCPDHAAELIFDEHQPHAHVCPIDGKVWSGPPYDDSWYWTANRRLAQRAYRLALLWRLSGVSGHFDKAREILLAYAHAYPNATSPRTDATSVGKIAYHALDESVWVIPITWACHWLWPDLAASERDTLRTDLLEKAARHIESQRTPRIHNYDNWLNAALATLGAALGDATLIERVIAEPFGFLDQMNRGVLPDGHWYEGAASYHFFTLGAALALAQALEGTRQDQRAHPSLRAMWQAPLRIAYPDYALPAINDCWYHANLLAEVGHGIPSGPAFYEVAAGWFPAPEFDGVLTAAYRDGPRDSVEALLYGPDRVARASPPPLVETNEAASGFAVLRPNLPADRSGYLLLKYGPHGGGHGHADKLGLSGYGDGERWSGDLGTPGYGIEINDTWYRHTLSHSSIVLEGEPQPPADGELLRYRPVRDTPFGIVDAQVLWEQGPYAAVYGRRLLLVRDGYFLVLTHIEAPVERDIQVVFHHAGVVSRSPETTRVPPDLPINPAYAHLTEVEAWDNTDGTTVGLALPSGDPALTLSVAPIPGSQLVLCRSPGNPASDTRATAIVRVRATDLWVGVAFVYSDSASVRWDVTAGTEPPRGASVAHGGAGDTWSFTAAGDAEFAYPLA